MKFKLWRWVSHVKNTVIGTLPNSAFSNHMMACAVVLFWKVTSSCRLTIMSEPFKWSSPAGQTLCRNILKDNPLEYEPHNWQVEGICQSLNGIDLFAITPTGSGKTSYFTMYILVVLAVSKNSSLCPTSKFPKVPCLIVICPTIPLQLEMVCAQKSLN